MKLKINGQEVKEKFINAVNDMEEVVMYSGKKSVVYGVTSYFVGAYYLPIVFDLEQGVNYQPISHFLSFTGEVLVNAGAMLLIVGIGSKVVLMFIDEVTNATKLIINGKND